MKNRWLQLFFHLALIAGLICFISFFYLKIENTFLTYCIIIMSIILLILKLKFWYTIKNYIFEFEKKSVYLQRLAICLFTYISPIYCIIQEPYLIVDRYISLITFIIVTIFAIIGIIMDLRLNLKISQKNL